MLQRAQVGNVARLTIKETNVMLLSTGSWSSCKPDFTFRLIGIEIAIYCDLSEIILSAGLS